MNKMMNKIIRSKIAWTIVAMVAAVAMTLLSGCTDYFTGNRKIFWDGSHSFDTAVVRMGEKVEKVGVKEWCDYESGDEVQIWTTDGRVILTSYMNVVLIKNRK